MSRDKPVRARAVTLLSTLISPCRAKAVANGAVLHFLDNLVTVRSCETNYGITCDIVFNNNLTEHQARRHLIREHEDATYIGPTFSCIAAKVRNCNKINHTPLTLHKNTTIGVDKVFIRSYWFTGLDKKTAADINIPLLRYDGDGVVPLWYSENKRNT